MSAWLIPCETDTTTEPISANSVMDASRLQQMTAARNADRIWRAGRKAELERLINRSFVQLFLSLTVLIALTQWGMHVLAPTRAPRSMATWPGSFWGFCELLLLAIIWGCVGSAFRKRLRPLRAELKAYEEKPGDPVIWSSGLVIHPPVNEERNHSSPLVQGSESKVVWSSGMVISTLSGPETPPGGSSQALHSRR